MVEFRGLFLVLLVIGIEVGFLFDRFWFVLMEWLWLFFLLFLLFVIVLLFLIRGFFEVGFEFLIRKLGENSGFEVWLVCLIFKVDILFLICFLFVIMVLIVLVVGLILLLVFMMVICIFVLDVFIKCFVVFCCCIVGFLWIWGVVGLVRGDLVIR